MRTRLPFDDSAVALSVFLEFDLPLATVEGRLLAAEEPLDPESPLAAEEPLDPEATLDPEAPLGPEKPLEPEASLELEVPLASDVAPPPLYSWTPSQVRENPSPRSLSFPEARTSFPSSHSP